jgi:hypothetical protein
MAHNNKTISSKQYDILMEAEDTILHRTIIQDMVKEWNKNLVWCNGYYTSSIKGKTGKRIDELLYEIHCHDNRLDIFLSTSKGEGIPIVKLVDLGLKPW